MIQNRFHTYVYIHHLYCTNIAGSYSGMNNPHCMSVLADNTVLYMSAFVDIDTAHRYHMLRLASVAASAGDLAEQVAVKVPVPDSAEYHCNQHCTHKPSELPDTAFSAEEQYIRNNTEHNSESGSP